MFIVDYTSDSYEEGIIEGKLKKVRIILFIILEVTGKKRYI